MTVTAPSDAERDSEDDVASGRFLRPKSKVLPASALIPAANLIEPPPNSFTHRVDKPQPYWYQAPATPAAPGDGMFGAATSVLLMGAHDAELCRVADGRGLYVLTARDGLRPIG
jgi:hypothetical protein